jgi:four helix bundle protein
MIDMPFQKLQVWQKGIVLVDRIYDITTQFPKHEMFGLSSQMQRSAVSVPSNIAEGSQRTSQKEFGNFVLIAKGSLAELLTQLIIAHKRKYITDETFEEISAKITELDKMLRAFFLKLTRK